MLLLISDYVYKETLAEVYILASKVDLNYQLYMKTMENTTSPQLAQYIAIISLFIPI